jgi:hypothetical protein
MGLLSHYLLLRYGQPYRNHKGPNQGDSSQGHEKTREKTEISSV